MEAGDDLDVALGRVAAGCIAVRVRLINRVISAVYDDALRPYGLRISQANILVAVAQHQAIRPTDLSRLLRIEKSTLSRDVEVMKRQGWLASDPPTGGRNQILQVTATGRELLLATLPAWERAQERAQEMLGAAGVTDLVAMAARLGFDRHHDEPAE